MIICVCAGQNTQDVLEAAEELRSKKLKSGAGGGFSFQELHKAYGGRESCQACQETASDLLTGNGFELLPDAEVSTCQSEGARLTSSQSRSVENHAEAAAKRSR